MTTAERFETLFEGCTATMIEVDGEDYVVTEGTGDGCFAYPVIEAAVALDAAAACVEARQSAKDAADANDERFDDDFEPYAEFCAAADAATDVAVAWAAFDEGFVIDAPGSCVPVLSKGIRALARFYTDRATA